MILEHDDSSLLGPARMLRGYQLGDLIAEADAARAHDAALVIQADARADIDVLGLLRFVLTETAFTLAVLDAELLQTTLARLIADRAVERMVGEQELHHTTTALLGELAFGADAHALADGVGAGDHGARHPADLGKAVLVFLGLGAGSGTRRHAHLDEAHTAVARRAELRVVAVVGHLGLHLLTGLDHARAFGELVPSAIDLHIDHVHGRLGGGGAGGV